eukprot:1250693-Prorocentrum_lima.AAC.1
MPPGSRSPAQPADGPHSSSGPTATSALVRSSRLTAPATTHTCSGRKASLIGRCTPTDPPDRLTPLHPV